MMKALIRSPTFNIVYIELESKRRAKNCNDATVVNALHFQYCLSTYIDPDVLRG